MSSGMSTPSSQATTLVGSPNLRATLDRENRATSLPSSAILEYYSSKASSAIFLYDLAREAGLGNVVRTLRGTESVQEHAVVFDIQSRAGAGLTLLGRISEGTSSAATKALTAYTTPSGLAQMQPVLGLFPQPSSGSRLVLQIPTITHWGEDLAILPTLANLTPFFSSIPENFSVLLSATPQEIIDFAAISYSISGSHVIHIFDQWSAGRQVSNKKTSYQTVSVPSPTSGIHTEFTRAGYSFFEYVGPTDASDIIVILNGPLALAIKNILTIIPSLGVVIVKVLRPWDETNLRGVIPPSAQTIHVLDDVSSTTSSTPLYHDVLGAMASPSSKTTRISSIRLETKTLSQVLVSAQSLVGYLSSILPINWFAAPEIPARASKRIVFYSNPTSSLREVPSVASQLFVSNPNINAQLLQNVDAFSKPGGVAQSTLTIGSTKDGVDDTPIPFKNGQSSDTDALMILDSSLLKTHDVFSELKEGSPVLIVTTWGGEEVISNLSRANLETIGIKKPHLLLVNAEATAANLRTPALDIVVSYAAFLRLYLGQVAKYDVLAALLTSLFGKEVHGVSIDKIARASWDALQSIPLPDLTVTEDEVVPSREFTFNTIEANSTDSLPQPVVKTSSWIEAAKNFVFREAFAISGEPVPSTEFRQNPALRPDLAEHRFLVTCTVNRRLTPLEYNRNVFHLEFDTHGTGLKYEIGEALGVHGWNDEHEVLNFCKWYGLNPDDVISIPVGGDPTKRHVRTIFQAFQQQIDIFGKPPKGFYEALSGYAKGREDRMALRFISSAEGSSTFKKLSELETVTFADVLQKFSSAKPPVEALCEIVGDIKPRHYSIASAQSAVGDRVDLLVVTVEWANPSGK
ncbi:hypothetical protein FRC19_010750 [Serendipita sp. 401]|nr:hypothetical protein FRC19_010750 [Serendipita sp. 401]